MLKRRSPNLNNRKKSNWYRHVTRQFNAAAIYISHDLAVVVQLADRIRVLRYGNLVEEGVSRDILDNPKQEYTRQLLSARSTLGAKQLTGTDSDVVLEVQNLSASYVKGIESATGP